MWETLTRADLEEARAQLGQRRDALLARQAEEIRGLDDEAAEIATLARLIGEFAARFGRRAAAAAIGETAAAQAAPGDAAAPAASRPAAATMPAAARPASPGPASRGERGAGKRNPSQSNFDTFARALSNSI